MIELKDVIKVYGKGGAQVKALNNINLKIDDGELVAITGPSGSGKSTLLNIIGCIDKCTSGKYLINNEAVEKFSEGKMATLRNEEFGFVLQYFGLINDYTAFENIQLTLKYSNKKRKNKKEYINQLLKKMHIEEKADNYPTELSGGQCQRVAIARALVNEPKVILADEPTGALDKKNGEEILDILIDLNKKGKTVIIVTHDENVYSKCNRIIKIEDGCIMED